jgi:hypothetical protein
MRTPTFRIPQNLDRRDKISYKGKIDLVREKRKENPRLVEKELGMDYRFHTVKDRRRRPEGVNRSQSKFFTRT